MADLDMGTLYDVNKMYIRNFEKAMSLRDLEKAKEEIKLFVSKTDNFYYMLLCHERRDYTIFKFNKTIYGNEYNIKVLVDEIVTSRGEVRSIETSTDNQAIEIWIVIDDEAYCYYFFPYDAGVIDEV